jgi:hypothetical protein
MRKFSLIGFLAAWLAAAGMVSLAAAAERVYQEPENFLRELFGRVPEPGVLWLTRDMQADVTRILGHAPAQLRQRYWSDGSRTAWVLEEIGKEDFITSGFVVKDSRIEQVKVLVYRENRGMEVRYPTFLRQFQGAGLSPDNRLDRDIDGISGATLSVRAMKRMSREALYFDRMVRHK